MASFPFLDFKKQKPTLLQKFWLPRLPHLPMAVWLILFVVIPTVLLIVVSFLSQGKTSPVALPFTFDNFMRLAGFGAFGFDPLGYPTIIVRSVLIALATMVLCGTIGIPATFALACLPRAWRHLALTGVVIPFWTNLLIRTYGWQLVLGPPIYPGLIGVLIGLTSDFLPLFVLPLYASVEKIDWSLADAARDLGGRSVQTFRHGVLPQISSGLKAGLALVFIPALGQFLVSDLLGGGKIALLGNVIDQQFRQSRDWPFGAAISVAVLVVILFMLRYGLPRRERRAL